MTDTNGPTNDDAIRSIMEHQEVFVDIYPCSCGHCLECGLNFVPTDREVREWSVEDGIEHWPWEERVKYYSGS